MAQLFRMLVRRTRVLGDFSSRRLAILRLADLARVVQVDEQLGLKHVDVFRRLQTRELQPAATALAPSRAQTRHAPLAAAGSGRRRRSLFVCLFVCLWWRCQSELTRGGS